MNRSSVCLQISIHHDSRQPKKGTKQEIKLLLLYYSIRFQFKEQQNSLSSETRFHHDQKSLSVQPLTAQLSILWLITFCSTGTTGYIGGSVLHTLITAHPTWSFTVLLRRTPPNFTATYPSITILTGDYSSTHLLSAAAAAADIVVHCGDSDHEPSLSALITGLLTRETPGYLIHLSGTGIVSDWAEEKYLGRLNPKVWSDLSSEDIKAVRALPDGALHRNTEKILHRTVQEHQGRIHVAIMCPPDIYGRGLGPGKKTSALIPFFVTAARAKGCVFFVGEGANTRSWVHVEDLMRVYLRVVEAAASGESDATEKYFGENGYHFASTQEHAHIDVARKLGEVLAERGAVEDKEPVEVSVEELDGMKMLPKWPILERYLFASNSRTRAERARMLWGFEAREKGLLECIEGDVGDVLAQGEE